MFKRYLFTVLRYFFAILFITTAAGKLLDNRGFAEVIVTYQLVPPSFALVLGLVVSLIELFLGFYLMSRWSLLNSIKITVLIQLGYVALAVLTLYRGIELKNCGCFGVFLARPLTFATVIEDTILLILSVTFYLLYPIKEKQNG